MKAPPRMFARAIFALACLLAALPATAQTLLLVVHENADRRPLPPPLAVREGISSSLFDAGFIVLDAPGSAPMPDPAELARMARAAGAEIVVAVAAEYADTNMGSDMVRISARTSYVLIDSSTGEIVAQGAREATNK
ncbi:MAG: hypothetical protein ABSG21_15820, partial [Spirochaetia bacterium]